MTPIEALQRIARSYHINRNGKLAKMPREMMLLIARDICDHLGISYAQKEVIVADVPKAEAPPRRARRKAKMDLPLVRYNHDARHPALAIRRQGAQDYAHARPPAREKRSETV